MNNSNSITSYEQALDLLDNYLLISKPYGSSSLIYQKKDDKILVFNQNAKYYISFEKFREDFHLSKFYIFKSLDELEIDQEHHNLRQ